MSDNFLSFKTLVSGEALFNTLCSAFCLLDSLTCSLNEPFLFSSKVEFLKNSILEDVQVLSEKWNIYDYDVQVLSVNGLIAAKEKAGREKDVPGLKILYALRDSELDGEE